HAGLAHEPAERREELLAMGGLAGAEDPEIEEPDPLRPDRAVALLDALRPGRAVEVRRARVRDVSVDAEADEDARLLERRDLPLERRRASRLLDREVLGRVRVDAVELPARDVQEVGAEVGARRSSDRGEPVVGEERPAGLVAHARVDDPDALADA